MALTTGSLLAGRYRIVRLLGSGGMGEVYEALEAKLGKRVAVKTLLPEFATQPDLLKRFKREAETAASLGHPNLVQVVDFQVPEGEPPILVMELLEGENLKDVLEREKRLDPGRTAFIGIQILSGLAAAHQVAIVHRDIKPANVFLQSTLAMRDLAKVVDFGLAKLVADATQTMPAVTRNGQILGTLAYMAPEQASGGPLDARVDIYAVGATLFHCITGLRPYEVVELGKGKSSIATHAPWIDRNLAAVIDKALEKHPEDRWQSAEQMAQALAPFAVRPTAGKEPPRAPGPTAAPTMGPTMGQSAHDATPAATAPTALAPAAVPPTVAATAHGVAATYGMPPPSPYASHPAGYAPPPPYVSYPPVTPGVMPARKSGFNPVLIGVLAVVVLGVGAPFAYTAFAMFRATSAVADARTNAEKNFLKTAQLPACPNPDRCTEEKEDHGVTYPLCTNKTPQLNPFKQGEFLLVKFDDGARLALVMTPPSGKTLTVSWMMIGGQDDVDSSKVIARVCRARPTSSGQSL